MKQCICGQAHTMNLPDKPRKMVFRQHHACRIPRLHKFDVVQPVLEAAEVAEAKATEKRMPLEINVLLFLDDLGVQFWGLANPHRGKRTKLGSCNVANE
jgi:hypothetical protein